MKNKKNVPDIRFKGFVEPWIKGAFGEFGSVSMNRRIFKHQTTPSGEIPFYKIGTFGGEPDSYISRELFEEYKRKYPYPQIGDILISASGSIGRLVEYCGAEEYFQDSNIVWLAHDERLSNLFLKYLYAITKWNGLEGSTIKRLYNKNILDTTFMIPNPECSVKSIDEQKAIGDYFQNVDRLINASQTKLDKLKNIKKACLEKMFPKNGSTTPELRFKGFAEPWEEITLGTLMDVTSVKRIHQSDWTDNGIRFLRARDIVSSFKNERIKDLLYISEERYSEYSVISGKVQKGDLLVTGVGTIGVPMLIVDDNPLYFKDGNIIWFKNKNILDGDFLFYSFTNSRIQNYINESAGTGTVGTYTIESGKKTQLLRPKDKEQEKTGFFFRNLDELIAKTEQQINKLKNIKKACLDKMFVNE